MNKTWSVAFFAVLLTLGTLPTVQAQTAGTIEFVDLDQNALALGTANRLWSDTDNDGIFDLVGTGAIGLVRVTDPDLVNQAVVAGRVIVRSAHDNTGEQVTLYQDPLATSQFVGFFGVETTAVAGNGRVNVQNNDLLTATYTDESPSGTLATPGTGVGRMEWRAATTATLAAESSLYSGTSARAVFTLTDADRNTDPAVNNLASMRVNSQRDPVGIVVNLRETGADTGVFKNDQTTDANDARGLGFSTTGSADATNLIKVDDGGTVTASYDDFDARGHKTTLASNIVWRATSTATIAFTDSTFRNAVSGGYHGLGTGLGFLRVEDPDLLTTTSIVARVTSNADVLGLPVTLTQTGAGTGEFTGSFGFDQVTTGSGKVQVANGDTLTAKVTDTATAAGGTAEQQTPTTPAVTWTEARNGEILLFQDDQAATPLAANTVLDTSKPLYVEVRDRDVTGSLTVRTTSTKDSVGLPVTLTQTGAGTGIFRGCFNFQVDSGGDGTDPTSPGACSGGTVFTTASSGELLVRNGSDVVVTYIDAKRANGAINTTVNSVTTKVNTGQPTAASTATIAFKHCMSDCGNANLAALAAATSFFGKETVSATDGTATAFIEVTDANFNTVTGTADKFCVVLGSSSPTRTVAWSGSTVACDAAADDGKDLSNGGGIQILVTETGVNTGVFRGSFSIEVGQDTDNVLDVTGLADTIHAAYSYASHPTNAPPACAPPAPPGTPGCTIVHNDRVGMGVVRSTIPWAQASTADVEFRTQLHGSGLAPGGLAGGLAGLGTGYIYLTGIDPSEDTTNAANTVTVRVKSTSDPTGIQVTLTERYGHGNETGGLHVTGDHGFIGQFTLTSGASNDATDLLKVGTATPENVVVQYVDPHLASGSAGTVQDLLVWKPSALGTLAFDPTVFRGAPGTAKVRVVDADRNLSPTVADSLDDSLWVYSDSDPRGVALDMDETGVDTSTFEVDLAFVTAPDTDPATLQVADGDSVFGLYGDATDAAGQVGFVNLRSQWFTDSSSPFSGALLAFNAASYVGTTGTGQVSLTDTDANTGSVDEKAVLVFSDSDPTGEPILVRETGATTNVFQGTFGFETTRTVGNGKVFVATGDRISTYFLDEPAGKGTTPDQQARLAHATWTLTGNVAPVVTLTAAPSSGAPPLAVTFTASATDSDGTIASFTLDFGDGSTAQAGAGAPPATVAHTYSAAGTYTAKLTAVDSSGNSANKTVTVTVGTTTTTTSTTNTDTGTNTNTNTNTNTGTNTNTNTNTGGPLDPLSLTPDEILDANNEIVVTVERDGDDNVISWELPDPPIAPVLGVQVWRSNSPYTLVQNIPASDPDFDDAEVRDTGDAARATTKYLVTMYYGATAALGFFPAGSAPDTEDYPGLASTDEQPEFGGGDGGGLPTWAIVLIVLGVLFLVVLVAILIARGRNRDDQQGSGQAYAWQESEAKAAEGEWQSPGEVHQARCPACATSFTATGQKPIVTVCPGCGKKGILR